MLELWTQPETWLSFLTLAFLEIVLGIDNIVFISILTSELPKQQRRSARKIGLGLALFGRLALLFTISWVMGLNAELFMVGSLSFSGRSLILLGGGVFLITKATKEIHESLEVTSSHQASSPPVDSFAMLMVQILFLDLVFSLDSVITAVGMVDHLSIMVAAVSAAVFTMLVFADAIGDFVSDHPSIKMLALSFLILIGVMLFAEGFGQHIPKGYIYFSMAFSFGVELVNMRHRKQEQDIVLHGEVAEPPAQAHSSEGQSE